MWVFGFNRLLDFNMHCTSFRFGTYNVHINLDLVTCNGVLYLNLDEFLSL
jgi:hypothetical protein